MQAVVTLHHNHGTDSYGGKMRYVTSCLVAAGAMACACQAGHCQSLAAPPQTVATSSNVTPPPASTWQSLEGWLNQSTMTGDWGGVRTELANEGYNIRGSYIGNYAQSFSGGERIGGDYAQQWELGVDVDMGKVAGWTGGTFHFSLNAREGRNTTTDYIGNKIDVQEIYGNGQNFRLAEMSYEQVLFHDTLNIKAGWTVMGDEFGKTPILCDFENDAFCAHPLSLPLEGGWNDYPVAHWGARFRLNLLKDIYAEFGVYDVNPSDNLHDNGFKLALNGSTGVIFPVEFGKTVALGPDALPGHYKVGGYFDSSQGTSITNPHVTFSGKYGGYVLADQMVWRFAPGTDRGLIVVANATISDKRTSIMPYYFTFALIVQGPFAARPHDFIEAGVVHDWVNNNLVKQQSALLETEGVTSPDLAMGENNVEIGYGIQATPWMELHPNLQFVGNPGAFSFTHVRNAWVFGAEVKITF